MERVPSRHHLRRAFAGDLLPRHLPVVRRPFPAGRDLEPRVDADPRQLGRNRDHGRGRLDHVLVQEARCARPQIAAAAACGRPASCWRRGMTRFSALLAGMLLCGGAAFAQPADVCAVSEDLLSTDVPLPHVAEAVTQAKRLQVAVVGSASSTLRGASGVQHAYPAQLEAELGRRLAGVAVKVVPHIQQGTTADMATTFLRLIAAEKPNLVIWQTGTTDVMLGTEPDSFQDALDKGIQALQTGGTGTDVVLMNLQHSPRTDPMMHVGPYAHAMRVV